MNDRINYLKSIVNKNKRNLKHYKSYIELLTLIDSDFDLQSAYEQVLTELAVAPYDNSLNDISIVKQAYQELVEQIKYKKQILSSEGNNSELP
jgi:hypothetical protein